MCLCAVLSMELESGGRSAARPMTPVFPAPQASTLRQAATEAFSDRSNRALARMECDGENKS